MSFLKRVYASLENPNRSLSDPDAWSEVLGTRSTKAGVRVSMKKALGFPPLLRGITKISSDVAKLRVHTNRRTADGGAERDKRHPAYALMRRKPNRVMTAGVFKKVLQFHALWHGNGYAAVSRRRDGDPLPASVPNGGLCVLDPDPQVTFPVQADGRLWYVTKVRMRDTAGNVAHEELIRIPGEDVVHIRGLSLDGLLGLSTFDLVRETLGMALATQEFAARFFGQGANASGVLMVPGHLKKEAQENVLRAWDKMATGMSKAHKVALIQDGTKFQPLTVDPEKAQMIGVQELSARQIANILGLPPHMLGDGTRTAYNSIEAENRNYLESSLDNWLCAWEEELEDKLLREDEKEADSHFIEFNRKQLLMMNLKDRAEAYRKLREIGGMSANDVMRAESMPTIGAGGDARHIPGNWQPLSGAVVPKNKLTPGRDAHRALLADRFLQLQKAEWNAVTRIADRHKSEFRPQIDAFYEKHAARMSEALTPAVRACFAIGNHPEERVPACVTKVVTRYTVRAREELYAVAEHSELADAVRESCGRLCLETAALVDIIMEGSSDAKS